MEAVRKLEKELGSTEMKLSEAQAKKLLEGLKDGKSVDSVVAELKTWCEGGGKYDFIRETSYDIRKLKKTQTYVDKSVVESMKLSILKEGAETVPPIRVLIYNGEALIVEGHHRLEAFKQLGYDRVPIKYVRKSQLGKIQSNGEYFRTLEEILSGKIYE